MERRSDGETERETEIETATETETETETETGCMLAEVGLFKGSPKVRVLATALRGEGGAPRLKTPLSLFF